MAAFTPEAIAAIVDKAQFSDPSVVDYVTGTLIRRRELVLRTWLTGLTPIANARIEGGGVLRFDNAAVAARIAEPPDGYELAWFHFDNTGGHHRYLDHSPADSNGVAAVPADEVSGAEYIGVEIRAVDRHHPQWRLPVRIYFRATHDGWTAVGIDRRADVSGERYALR